VEGNHDEQHFGPEQVQGLGLPYTRAGAYPTKSYKNWFTHICDYEYLCNLHILYFCFILINVVWYAKFFFANIWSQCFVEYILVKWANLGLCTNIGHKVGKNRTYLQENLTNMCKIGEIVFGRIGSRYSYGHLRTEASSEDVLPDDERVTLSESDSCSHSSSFSSSEKL
jgi:hypothetical protein